MKKRFSIAPAGMMMAVLAGCSSAAEETLPVAEETKMEAGTQTAAEETVPETVIIRSYNGEKEQIELEVPYDPQRIAILDMASRAGTGRQSRGKRSDRHRLSVGLCAG